MKVLHLINTLAAGGAELHLLTLCRYLRQKNVHVVVACLREQIAGSRSLRLEFENEGIRVISLRANSRYNSLFLKRVTRVLHSERPDILHTHLPRADFAGAFARIFNSELIWICSAHAIYSQDWSGRWSLPLFNLIWRRADIMLCISHAVRDWLVRRGVPPGKAKVIHYGIEAQTFREARVNLRERWGLNDKAVIGSIGRLEPGKNHECLIAAMPQICRAVPNAVLLIAGHDPWGYGATLQRQIGALGLRKKVRLVGFQNDIGSFLAALDVFAFATKSEGFGQVVIEAMAAGKPVVTSEIPPLTEIVVDGETGLLVESGNTQAFADAISRLLKSPVERERMGKRGRGRVEKYFTAERMARETILLYDEVLRRRSALKASA